MQRRTILTFSCSQAKVAQSEPTFELVLHTQLIMTNSQDAIAIDVLKNRYADVGMIASGALESKPLGSSQYLH